MIWLLVMFLRLQRQLGLTTIFVTHDQEEANTTSDRMAVLNDGVIQQVGTPQELYDKPSNLFVANFLGTVNTLEGYVETDGDQERFVTKTGDVLSLPQGGTGANILLRPQKISIQQQSSANALCGKIFQREFLGGQVRYLIDAGGAELVVDQTHGGGREWFSTGSEVYLSVNTSNAVVICFSAILNSNGGLRGYVRITHLA